MEDSLKDLKTTVGLRLGSDRPSTTWRESFLAGLPLLLNGLLTGTMYLVFIVAPPGSDAWQGNVMIVIGLLLSLAAVFVVFSARRRGWPTWVGSWIPLSLFSLLYTMQILDLVISDALPWQIDNAIFFGVVVLIFVTAAILFNRDRVASLLVTFFFFPFLGMAVIDPIPYELGAVVCVCLGLLTGLAAALAVHLGRWLVGAGVGLATNLVAGLLTLSIYSWGLQALGYDALAFTDLLIVMAIYLMVTLFLMLTPVVLWVIFDWLKRLVKRQGLTII